MGALAGWWLAAFVIRRYLLHGPRVRKAVTVIGTPVLIMVGINASGVFAGTAVALVRSGSGTAQSVLLGQPAGVAPLAPVFAALALAAIGPVLFRPARRPVTSAEYGFPGP